MFFPSSEKHELEAAKINPIIWAKWNFVKHSVLLYLHLLTVLLLALVTIGAGWNSILCGTTLTALLLPWGYLFASRYLSAGLSSTGSSSLFPVLLETLMVVAGVDVKDLVIIGVYESALDSELLVATASPGQLYPPALTVPADDGGRPYPLHLRARRRWLRYLNHWGLSSERPQHPQLVQLTEEGFAAAHIMETEGTEELARTLLSTPHESVHARTGSSFQMPPRLSPLVRGIRWMVRWRKISRLIFPLCDLCCSVLLLWPLIEWAKFVGLGWRNVFRPSALGQYDPTFSWVVLLPPRPTSGSVYTTRRMLLSGMEGSSTPSSTSSLDLEDDRSPRTASLLVPVSPLDTQTATTMAAEGRTVIVLVPTISSTATAESLPALPATPGADEMPISNDEAESSASGGSSTSFQCLAVTENPIYREALRLFPLFFVAPMLVLALEAFIDGKNGPVWSRVHIRQNAPVMLVSESALFVPSTGLDATSGSIVFTIILSALMVNYYIFATEAFDIFLPDILPVLDQSGIQAGKSVFMIASGFGLVQTMDIFCTCVLIAGLIYCGYVFALFTGALLFVPMFLFISAFLHPNSPSGNIGFGLTTIVCGPLPFLTLQHSGRSDLNIIKALSFRMMKLRTLLILFAGWYMLIQLFQLKSRIESPLPLFYGQSIADRLLILLIANAIVTSALDLLQRVYSSMLESHRSAVRTSSDAA